MVGTGIWRVEMQSEKGEQLVALIAASSIQDACIKAVRWGVEQLKLKDPPQVYRAEFVGTIDA
jgi:hypothetical protein